MGHLARAREVEERAGRVLPAILRTRLSGLRVAVDVQHLYRPWPHKADHGAIFGLLSGLHIPETAGTTLYAHALIAWLLARGADVLANDPIHNTLLGPYERREKVAAAWGAHAYLACHINAGGGSYGRVAAMNGSAGVALAGTVAAALKRSIPELSEGQVARLAQKDRGSACIRFFPRAAVIVEPFFGDKATHQCLFDPSRLVGVGEAVGDGIAAWWATHP